MNQRETFGSRMGFLLLSAGCAIGIGNVWRFPYVVGQNGGGAFVLFYLPSEGVSGIRKTRNFLASSRLCSDGR